MSLVETQIDLEEAIAAVDDPFHGLPRAHFSVICADPPWHFKTRSETRQTRSAKVHYDVMSLDDICALPVQSRAAKDCMLLLWATNPMLPDALTVMAAWGFTFRTIAFTWAKTTPKTDGSWAPKWHLGLGYYTRSNSEICLLGTRGKPKRVSKSVRQLIVAPRREHSRKPDEFYSAVEALTDGPRLEMFARQERPNWSVWGNQTTKFNL